MFWDHLAVVADGQTVQRALVRRGGYRTRVRFGSTTAWIEFLRARTLPSHMTNWQTPVCQLPNRSLGKAPPDSWGR